MQVLNGGTKLTNSLIDGRNGATKRVRPATCYVFQILSGTKERLKCPVVERLGQRLPLAGLSVEGLRDEPPATRREFFDPTGAVSCQKGLSDHVVEGDNQPAYENNDFKPSADVDVGSRNDEGNIDGKRWH